MVRMPDVGITTSLVPLGLRADGTMQVPDNFEQAGWYVHGPRPGETGAAVIAGHVDSHTGPAVFYGLDELRRGDDILVGYDDGRTLAFEVTARRRYAKQGFPTEDVYSARGRQLRLITCAGSFDTSTGHYQDNLVVFARLIPPTGRR